MREEFSSYLLSSANKWRRKQDLRAYPLPMLPNYGMICKISLAPDIHKRVYNVQSRTVYPKETAAYRGDACVWT